MKLIDKNSQIPLYLQLIEIIKDMINNNELQKKIIDNLEQNDYSNADEVKKIYKLMGD